MAKPKKQNVAPSFGRLSRQELGRLRSELRGRLRSWGRRRPDAVVFAAIISIDLALMFRMGYPSKVVRRVWRQIYPEGEKNDLVMLCLIWFIMRVLTSRPRPQPFHFNLTKSVIFSAAFINRTFPSALRKWAIPEMGSPES